MLASYSLDQIGRLAPDALGDALERGEIVHFPRCPIELPAEADLKFLREDLATHLRNKNVSYHPETDSVPGLRSDPVRTERAQRILKQHAARVEAFLTRTMPTLTRLSLNGIIQNQLPSSMRARNRLQLSRRAYRLLRLLRVPEHALLTRTPFTPMRMTAVPETWVRSVVSAAGGEVAAADPLADPGASRRYWVVAAARP